MPVPVSSTSHLGFRLLLWPLPYFDPAVLPLLLLPRPLLQPRPRPLPSPVRFLLLKEVVFWGFWHSLHALKPLSSPKPSTSLTFGWFEKWTSDSLSNWISPTLMSKSFVLKASVSWRGVLEGFSRVWSDFNVIGLLHVLPFDEKRPQRRGLVNVLGWLPSLLVFCCGASSAVGRLSPEGYDEAPRVHSLVHCLSWSQSSLATPFLLLFGSMLLGFRYKTLLWQSALPKPWLERTVPPKQRRRIAARVWLAAK